LKSTGLLVAASLLLVLTGVIWWSNKREAVASKPDSNAAPKILTLDASAVTSLSIRKRDQGTTTLDRDHEAWRITAPAPLAADRESVASLLSTLSSLSSEHLIADKVSDPASYGLADPALKITVSLKDHQTRELLIGDQTPAGNAYYAMLSGDPRVFTLASYNQTSLDKSSNDLRDKRLLTADFDQVSQIELSNQKGGKKQQITFARNKDAWQILRPVPSRAATDQVAELIRSLGEAKMEVGAAADAGKTAAAFSSASPFASVKVTGASGTEVLEIRKSKDDYYAKSSALAGVFQVAAASATALDKSLDDFRDKKLFDLGYQDPDKIEIHDGALAYFFTRSGGDWWGADGKKLDESSVEPLVEKLRALTAQKFPESGFSAPVLELRVTSNAGKRVEQVAVAKKGDAYLAKRENEAALYELAAKDIEELEGLCKKVKPLAVAPKK
jgi:hypothetical protein